MANLLAVSLLLSLAVGLVMGASVPATSGDLSTSEYFWGGYGFQPFGIRYGGFGYGPGFGYGYPFGRFGYPGFGGYWY